MLCALSIDHIGKPHRPHDRGAVSPEGVEEVTVTSRYVLAADQELRRLGHESIVLADGPYSERQKRADAYGAMVYVACHADAGGGSRGTIYYDYRTPKMKGISLAQTAAVALDEVVPWPCSAKVLRPEDRGWTCIAEVKAVALLFEPGYLDCPNVAWRTSLVFGTDDIGRALARGIHVWAGGS